MKPKITLKKGNNQGTECEGHVSAAIRAQSSDSEIYHVQLLVVLKSWVFWRFLKVETLI